MSETAPELDQEHTGTKQLDYEAAMANGTESAVVKMPQPDLKGSRLGAIGRYYRIHKDWKKRRKLAKKGYVRWFLVDETFPEPKFVKPELKGDGMPEVRVDGKPYAFPRESMLADERTGMYTVVHKKGDAEPINLRDPAKTAIPVDKLDEWINLQLHKDPPSWLDNIDVSPRQIMAFALGATVLIAVIYPMLPG